MTRCQAWGCTAPVGPRRRFYCSAECQAREARGVRKPRTRKPYGEVHARIAALVAETKRRIG